MEICLRLGNNLSYPVLLLPVQYPLVSPAVLCCCWKPVLGLDRPSPVQAGEQAMTVATVSTAIILAAGLGSRLDPLTKEMPKCLVKVHGKQILRSTLEKLERARIEETVILVGYLANVVRKEIGSQLGRMKITYIESERYKETNNMYSLWLARE